MQLPGFNDASCMRTQTVAPFSNARRHSPARFGKPASVRCSSTPRTGTNSEAKDRPTTLKPHTAQNDALSKQHHQRQSRRDANQFLTKRSNPKNPATSASQSTVEDTNSPNPRSGLATERGDDSSIAHRECKSPSPTYTERHAALSQQNSMPARKQRDWRERRIQCVARSGKSLPAHDVPAMQFEHPTSCGKVDPPTKEW